MLWGLDPKTWNVKGWGAKKILKDRTGFRIHTTMKQNMKIVVPKDCSTSYYRIIPRFTFWNHPVSFAAHPHQRHCHIPSSAIPRWCISVKTSEIIYGHVEKKPSPNFKKLGTFVFHGNWVLHPPTTLEIPTGLLHKLNRQTPLPLATSDLYQQSRFEFHLWGPDPTFCRHCIYF